MAKSFDLVVSPVRGRNLTVFADRHTSLRQLLDSTLEFGERDFIIDGDRRITYAEHHAAVCRVATWMVAQGVGKGDRVGILGRNSIEWLVSFWSTVSIGAIAVGLNAWWSPEELDYAKSHCQPSLVIDDMSVIAEVMAGPEASIPDVDIDEDDPAVILYTSGTTGRPKGATHSHRNIVCLTQTQQHLTASRLPPGVTLPPPRVLNSTPLFHVSGLHSGTVACLASGGTTIWVPGRFDPKTTMAAIEREKPTSWSTMPTTLWRVVNSPDRKDYDLSSVFHVGGGGAAWSAALQASIKETFGDHVTWGVGYGLTECSGLATTAGFAELLENPASVGKPAATVEVRIMEQDESPDGSSHGPHDGSADGPHDGSADGPHDGSADGPHDGSGEILIRGPMVMLGYWNDPAATEKMIDADGWLHTGDLGLMVNGSLQLSTRRTDLILRGAENVYPAEIEGCLEGHPEIDEVAVIGMPDEEFGQIVAAVVVASPGSTITPEDLTGWVKNRLAYYKVPSRWIFRTDPLPRTATGKVVRAQVVKETGITHQIEERA